MATYVRKILINSVAFTDSVNALSFSWTQQGCDKATLDIASAAFDEDFGIKQEQDVDLRYGSSTNDRWWRGIVDEIETSIDGGLTIQCTGTKALLSEILPTGRFGTDVETTEPTDITLTEGTADTGAPGAAQTPHVFLVTAIDAEGETLAGVRAGGQSGGKIGGGPETATITPSAVDKKITVSWTASTNGATGYRVYINFDFGGALNKSDLLSVNGMIVYDVVGTSFVFDGSRIGEGRDFPFIDDPGDPATSIKPTIDDTEIEDAVGYLFDNFLPDEITKGTVDIGTLNVDLDYFDLHENSADFQKVLDSLVAIAGDVQWYVDEDNTIHFKEKITTINVSRKFVIKDVGSVLSTASNSLVGASKRRTRDGITNVKIVGTESLEQGVDASNTDLGVVWDSVTEPADISQHYYPITRDPRFISMGNPTGVLIPYQADLAWMESFSTLQGWLDAFPNYRFVWLHRNRLNGIRAGGDYLVNILDGIRRNFNGGGRIDLPEPILGRPRIAVRQFVGARTSLTAGIAAIHWLTRRSPNPLRWTMIIENVDSAMLVVPGQGNVQLTTQQGTRYQIPVQSATYEFNEAVRVIIIGGDEQYDATEELDDMRDAVLASSARKNSPTKWGEFSE